ANCADVGILRERAEKSPPRRTGYLPRIEQCVCVWGGLTSGYEAHGIGRQIRKTRTGIERAGNARRRRAEGALARPLWHEAPSEDSPLSPDRGNCPPNAGGGTRRAQAFGPPLSIAGRQQHGAFPTIAELPEPTSQSRNCVGARLGRSNPSGEGARRRDSVSKQTIQVTFRGCACHHRLPLAGDAVLRPPI